MMDSGCGGLNCGVVELWILADWSDSCSCRALLICSPENVCSPPGIPAHTIQTIWYRAIIVTVTTCCAVRSSLKQELPCEERCECRCLAPARTICPGWYASWECIQREGK